MWYSNAKTQWQLRKERKNKISKCYISPTQYRNNFLAVKTMKKWIMRYLKRNCTGFYNQHNKLKGGNPFKLNIKSLDSYRTQQYQASHIFDGTDKTALTLYSSLFYSSSRLCSIVPLPIKDKAYSSRIFSLQFMLASNASVRSLCA